MQVKFGVMCRSGGEEVGTLWGVSIEPRERLLLRIIIERPQADPLVRVKVPFASIARADADQLVLSISADQLEGLPAMVQESGDEGRRARRRRRGDEVLEKILTRQTPVFCRDGEAGPLSGVSVDERSGDVEEITFSVGVMTERLVSVRTGDIDDFDDGRLNIKLERDDLDQLSDGRL
jgi:hypothetical protein